MVQTFAPLLTYFLLDRKKHAAPVSSRSRFLLRLVAVTANTLGDEYSYSLPEQHVLARNGDVLSNCGAFETFDCYKKLYQNWQCYRGRALAVRDYRPPYHTPPL